MHLHFIFPRWKKLLEDRPELKEIVSGYDIGSFRMIGLGLSTAAGAVPPGNLITLVDENVAEIDYSLKPDLVCIGFFTPQASNAYRIARRFRQNGCKVIAGGIHPTMAKSEALPHFDSLVSGPVEGLWEIILKDLKAGQLKPFYQGAKDAPFAKARSDLFANSDYLKAGVIQTSRGCPVNCNFCVVPHCYGRSITYRPIDQVMADIEALPYPCFFFADENLLFADQGQLSYSRELLRLMIERKNRRVSFVASYPRFIKTVSAADWALWSKARLRQVYLVLGLMQPLCQELPDPDLCKAIKLMQQHEIEVLGSFTLGHPAEEGKVESFIDQFCQDNLINLAEFTIYTPFPGTPLFARLKRQKRILSQEWERYNGANVVFEPQQQSAQQLEALYLKMWQRFYGAIPGSSIHSRYVKGFGGGILR